MLDDTGFSGFVALDVSPQCEVSHTDFTYFYKDGKIRRSEYSSKKKKSFSGDIFFDLFRENFIRTSTVLIRKKTLDMIGVFDPELFMSEDYDLWLRVTKGRAVVSYIDKPLIKVRCHDSHITGDVQKTYMWVNKAIEKTVNSSSELADELKKCLPYRLAKNHFTIGYKFFCDKRFDEARSEFLKSLSYKIKCNAILYYIATLFGFETISFLRDLKQGVSKKVKGKK